MVSKPFGSSFGTCGQWLSPAGKRNVHLHKARQQTEAWSEISRQTAVDFGLNETRWLNYQPQKMMWHPQTFTAWGNFRRLGFCASTPGPWFPSHTFPSPSTPHTALCKQQAFAPMPFCDRCSLWRVSMIITDKCQVSCLPHDYGYRDTEGYLCCLNSNSPKLNFFNNLRFWNSDFQQKSGNSYTLGPLLLMKLSFHRSSRDFKFSEI